MKYITDLNIIAKLIFAVSIFIFSKDVLDYIYVPFINSMGFIVAKILAIWTVFKNFDIPLEFPKLKMIKYQLKKGVVYIYLYSSL